MRVLNLRVGFRLTEADISLFAEIDCNKQRAAATEQRIMMLLV